MHDLVPLLERYLALPGLLTGWELAADRGNLSSGEMSELADMRRDLTTLPDTIAARWAAASPAEIAAYDARVDALALLDPAAQHVATAQQRAPATRSPGRQVDPWAIWAVLTLTAA